MCRLVDELDKKILRIHLGLVLAEILCLAGFAFELSRALSGNALSWAYVFEWPLFGGYAFYMWRRFVADEQRVETGACELASTHPGAGDVAAQAALDDYNEYLRRVHEKPTEFSAMPNSRQR